MQNNNSFEEKKIEEPKLVNQIVQIPQEKKDEKVASQVKEKKPEGSKSVNQSEPLTIEKRDEKADLEDMKACRLL